MVTELRVQVELGELSPPLCKPVPVTTAEISDAPALA